MTGARARTPARRIEDMRAPPANRLAALKGDRAGQWSVRVNDQFRICCRWAGTDAEDVEIVDCHRRSATWPGD